MINTFHLKMTNQKSHQDVCPAKCQGNTTIIDESDDIHNGNTSIDLKNFENVVIQEASQDKNTNDKQCKKKKKKKKKKLSAYKKLLKSAKQSKYTEREKQQLEYDRIRKTTGGGSFVKHLPI